MRQSYKLRLGDGTVLLVDHAGLINWLSDRGALVQPAGDELWTPLRTFLVQERSAARRTARYRPQPPSTSRKTLPLVYPKPLEELAPGRPVADTATQHPDTPEENEHPIPARADGLPLIPPPLPEAALTPVPTPLHAPPLPPAAPPLPEPPASILPKPPDEEFEVDLRPCLAEAAPEPGPPIEHEDSAPLVVPPTPVETAAERVVPPASGEGAPSPDGGPGAPSLADEEDVGWMRLPSSPADEAPGLAAVSWLEALAPSSAGAPPVRLEEAPRPTPARACPAPGARGPFLSHELPSLARRAWRATRPRLASLASSSYAALLSLWKSVGPGEHAVTTFRLGELARKPVVGSEAGLPPPQQPPIGAPPGRIQAEKKRDSPRVYRPRRSPYDGLPLLQLEALDETEERLYSRHGSGAQRSTEVLPEIILEPIDEPPGAGSTRGQRARR